MIGYDHNFKSWYSWSLGFLSPSVLPMLGEIGCMSGSLAPDLGVHRVL
jgi:hypothetical protein